MEATGFIFFLMALFSLAVTVFAAFASTDFNDKGVEGFKPLGSIILNVIVGLIFMYLLSGTSAWWIFVFGPAIGVAGFNVVRKIAGNLLGGPNK